MGYPRRVAVLGGGECSSEIYELSVQVGRLLAENNVEIICGGLFGVMEAVCKGAAEAGGVTIGILPGNDPQEANRYVSIPIATGMGIGRNIIIVRSAPVCLAIDGKYGTLSEIAYALQLGKPVFGLKTWTEIPGVIHVTSPEEAVQNILKNLPE